MEIIILSPDVPTVVDINDAVKTVDNTNVNDNRGVEDNSNNFLPVSLTENTSANDLKTVDHLISIPNKVLPRRSSQCYIGIAPEKYGFN